MRGENPRSNDRKEIEIKRDIFSISISFFRAEREKLFKSGGGMEPDRSKQQQHTTARHRKLLLSNRMNENLCVCYVLNNFFISSFERNPFLFYITPEGFFFCFKLFTFFFTGLWPRSFVLSLWLFDVNIVPRAPAGGPGSFGVNLLLLLSSIRCVARKPSPSFTSILSIKRKKTGESQRPD